VPVARNEWVSLVRIDSVLTSKVGGALTVTTTHVSPAGFTCEAHTFTDPLGTFAGAVYVAGEVTPPDVVTVPTAELPPSTPFTFQVNGPVPPDVTLIVVDAPVTSVAVTGSNTSVVVGIGSTVTCAHACATGAACVTHTSNVEVDGTTDGAV
jgi:hypothetical protein